MVYSARQSHLTVKKKKEKGVTELIHLRDLQQILGREIFLHVLLWNKISQDDGHKMLKKVFIWCQILFNLKPEFLAS